MHGADSEGVPGVTTYRVIQKDRTFVDELHYKGWSVRLADWVHLSNPDDPSRPIIAQVFRCWVSEEPYVPEVLYCTRTEKSQIKEGATRADGVVVL